MATTRRRADNATEHECEGCQTLQLQIDDLNRAEAILLAAGLSLPEQVEKARKIVQDLRGSA